MVERRSESYRNIYLHTCTIFPRTLGKTSAGVFSDFALPVLMVNGGSSVSQLNTHNNGKSFSFDFTAPPNAGSVLIVTGTLANGTAFSQGAVSFEVFGIPDESSVLTCKALSTNRVRAGTNATCTIDVRTNSFSSRGIPADFQTPITRNCFESNCVGNSTGRNNSLDVSTTWIH